MNGEGARLHGGRWNPEGISAVYLADSRALAMLEILVHAPREALQLDWRVIGVEIDEKDIATPPLAALPDDWAELPSSSGARNFGAAWLRAGAGLALRLPSVVVPRESVLLLNPLHPKFSALELGLPETILFDSRLS